MVPSSGVILIRTELKSPHFPHPLLKDTGHYGGLLEIIVSIKTYLVMSNGELLIVQNIVRNLCNNGVFFLSLFSCNFDEKLSPNVHRFVVLCIMGYTKKE